MERRTVEERLVRPMGEAGAVTKGQGKAGAREIIRDAHRRAFEV